MKLFHAVFLTFRGQVCLFLLLIGGIGYTIFSGYRGNRDQVSGAQEVAKPVSTAKPSAAGDPLPAGKPIPVVTEFGKSVMKLAIPPEPAEREKEPPPKVIPEEVRKVMLAEPTSLSLFSDRGPVAAQKGSQGPTAVVPGAVYAPYGRMIVCRLVNAVDSANIETPIIGLVLEDVWNRDEAGIARIVVPAGAEVHGTATKGRMRDRIDATGRFVFVWRTGDDDNGLEMVVTGLALHRSYDESSGTFGVDDGSAGLRGEVIETDDYAEVKLFLSRFVSGLGSNLIAQTATLNPLTNQVVNSPKQSLGNAALQGADGVMQEYADRLRDSLKKDGYYVAVRPGKTFYVYVKETIDKRVAHRGAFLASNQQPVAPSNVPSLR